MYIVLCFDSNREDTASIGGKAAGAAPKWPAVR